MKLEEKEIATKGYISLLEIVEQTCHDPLQLFYDLQRYNPYTRDMRHSLRIALENVGYRLEKTLLPWILAPLKNTQWSG